MFLKRTAQFSIVSTIVYIFVFCFYKSVKERRGYLHLDLDADIITDSWLEMEYSGRCVSVTRVGLLVLQNCLPGSENQSFTLTSNRHLYHGGKQVCSGKLKDGARPLLTGNCVDPVQFGLTYWSGTNLSESARPLDNRTQPPRDPYDVSNSLVKFTLERTAPLCIGSAGNSVSLITCHKEHCSIYIISRQFISRERRALLLPIPPNSSCDYPACGLNSVQPGPAALLTEAAQGHCGNLTECLTIVCKTARRPLLVVRMLQAARDTIGYDIPAVVYDDGPEGYGREILEGLAEFPLLLYVIGDREVGISRGRNRAVELVKTRFFVILDDDFMLDTRSDLRLAVDILDNTDASVVGGSAIERGNNDWSGTLQFIRDETNRRSLLHTFQTCNQQPIHGFPGCFKCDITDVFFVGKRYHYLSVGGWSEELLVAEHCDFFLNLKADAKKLVFCPEFRVTHGKKSALELYDREAYELLRTGRKGRLQRVKLNHWNIEAILSSSFDDSHD